MIVLESDEMQEYTDIENCPIASVQKVIHGKWTMVIIYFLTKGTYRFSELKRMLPQVSEANLTKELRLLESYHLVHREVYREVPPKVEYSLTDLGKRFIPVLEALDSWAIEYAEYIKILQLKESQTIL